MNKYCIKAIISGKVQGVFFRNTTVKKAHELQLTGWVRNTRDGKVELIACGEHDHLMQLTDWLWEGSQAAEVANVRWEEVPLEKFDDFVMKR